MGLMPDSCRWNTGLESTRAAKVATDKGLIGEIGVKVRDF